MRFKEWEFEITNANKGNIRVKENCFVGAVVVPLANSRRVNHFAAGGFVGLRHFLAGLRALAGTHNAGVRVLYFMRVEEWGLK